MTTAPSTLRERALEEKILHLECDLVALADLKAQPIDMVLYCPACGLQHIDKDNSDDIRIEAAERGFDHGSRDWEDFIEEREWTNPPHRSHLCHGCGHIWRPADVPTNGVQQIKTQGEADSPPVHTTAGVGEDYRSLLSEVSACFTRDDDLPDNLLPRIDRALGVQHGAR